MKIVFFGAGNMASAIFTGMIEKGIVKPDDIYITSKSNRVAAMEYKEEFGVNVSYDDAELCKDADYIIYNSTIGGEIRTIDELLAKNELLAEFKAVQNGNVWCTSENMYQETTQLGQMIQSFQKVFSGEADELDELPYLYRLQ